MRRVNILLLTLAATIPFQLSANDADLHALVRGGDTTSLKLALLAGANADVFDEHERSLLQNALLSDNEDMVSLLLQNGADANARTRGFKKRPLLHIAVEKGNLSIVQMLLDRGADYNALDSRGLSAIDYAIVHYEAPIVKLLLSRGAALDPVHGTGEDQLMSATFNRDSPMVSLLLDAGARAGKEAIVSAQCSRCHNMDGAPNHPSIPHIAGQNYEYLRKQLSDFRSGQRQSIRYGQMNTVMHAMTDEMINAAASYYSGLPKVAQELQ